MRSWTGHGFRWWILAVLTIGVAGCNVPPKTAMPARHFQGITRVACVGDSITAGAGLNHPETQSYPAVLAQLLGPAYRVRNFGVSGATLLRGGDLPYATTPAFEEALAFQPQVVIIALGTNDSKPQNWRHRNALTRDLYSIVRAFQTLPSQPIVYVCTPPPVFIDRWGINEATVADYIRPTFRHVTARERWPLIDLHSALRNDGASFPDGVHPDAMGATRIATVIHQALRGR
jgi:lysophospholipase L1-like esterase